MTGGRAELLREAKALEDMGGEWSLAHAAAFCMRSVSYLTRSDCPKHYKKGQGVKGKRIVVLVPAEVRAWWAQQNVEAA